MTVSKKSFVFMASALLITILTYALTTILRNEICNSILSPLNAYLAGGILIFAYLRSERTVRVNIIILLYALACFVWAIADTAWMIISFTGGVPQTNKVLWVAYVITNCLFFGALVVFAVNQFRKWDFVQLTVDLTINGLLSIFLFWVLFFKKDITIFISFIRYDFTSVLSILTDILIEVSIYSWLLSVRSGKIPPFIKISLIGILLFTYSDIAFYYLDFNGISYNEPLIDYTYILSLSVIAFSGLWKTYKHTTVFDISTLMNIGGNRRWTFLLIYPGIIVLFASVGLVHVRLAPRDVIDIMGLIFFYWAACKYIQLSLEKEVLLKRDKSLLENRLAEQVNELAFLANQDTLTTLFNRRYFMSDLEDSLKMRRANETLALLIIDMDRFKMINDTFGHDIGDKVLIDFSYRMIEWNSYGATIARLGGDEFAVMLVGKYAQKDIEDLCTEIIQCGSTPFNMGENRLNLTMSVGIAVAPQDVCDGRTLLQNADIAMCRAKAQGYNNFQIYTPIMSQDVKKSAEIEVLLKQTSLEKDFELYYQPQYALPDKTLIGAEALIRWNNPQHGYIPPSVFIPIAEQIDYISRIGRWVIQEVVRQSIEWNNQYHVPLKVGFNISPKHFKDASFISLIKTVVLERGFNPEWIDAEITESIMMNEGERINDTFNTLRELGVSVSIDDFGSGYSSLGYLNKYPFDRIKIDKSLIDNISSRNIGGANVVRAAIDMAHASRIQAIAEGVETQEQLDILIGLGCDQVQGYLMGRPVPAASFVERYIKPYCEQLKIC